MFYLVGQRRNPVGQIRRGEACFAAGMIQNIGEFIGVQLGGNRNRRKPCVPESEENLEILRAVLHNDGNMIPPGQSQAAGQTGRQRGRSLRQIFIGQTYLKAGAYGRSVSVRPRSSS